jgi:hypothetical protein
MKSTLFKFTSLALVLVPVVSSAQGSTQDFNFGGFAAFFVAVTTFINNIVVPAVFALAFLVFIWGVFKLFILGGTDEGKREEGKSLVLYSIVGFVLMISIWGLVNLVAGSFGLAEQGPQNIPVAPGPRSANN